MKIFALAGSMRTGSYNANLIALAADEARRQGMDVTLGQFRELSPPVYDGDVEAESGLPPVAQTLARHIETADGLIISTPEYNESVPGPLKNAFDWVSRLKPYRFQDKPVLLLGASSGGTGAVNGMAALRITLRYQGAVVYPDVFSLKNGKTAFDGQGRFVDTSLNGKLADLIRQYLATVAARPLVS
jgi:NAD(P)H-dependent FMN reductase